MMEENQLNQSMKNLPTLQEAGEENRKIVWLSRR